MSKKSILVVDDHGPIRMILTGAIDRLGHDTVMAANGAEALAILEHRGDIALLVIGDLGPSGMSSAELGGLVADRWPELMVRFGPLAFDERPVPGSSRPIGAAASLSGEHVGEFTAKVAALLSMPRN